MTDTQAALRQAITSLEAQRALLGDTVTDAALAPLLAQLAAAASSAPSPVGLLRQVTVLMLDIVGSTALVQHLDPEAAHEVMDGALARFTRIVQAHQGRVLQYAGDSVLAAFGADGTREDDAARAVACGLALLAQASDEARQVQRLHGYAGLGARVGVHTGAVLLGAGLDEAGSIRGMTVHVAARLEQAGPPGALRISHDTWRHVQGLFVAQVQPVLQVKGRDEPLLSYLVESVREGAAQATRGLDGIDTPLLGRDDELARLLADFDTAAREGRARAWTLLGEAGVGKSRLVYEVQQHLQARGALTVLRARGHPAQQLQPYRLLRDLLASRLRIVDSDSAESARDKLCAGLAPAFASPLPGQPAGQGEAPVHAIGQLVGLDFSASPHVAPLDPRDLRNRALVALDHWLQSLAAEPGHALLLVADDLHWADEASLDLLQHWMAQALPVLVLATARPGLLERRPDWAQGVAGHTRLLLDALGAEASAQLAATLLRRLPQAPPALLALLTGHAEGNPYFMEELLKMLIDDGIVRTDGEHWQVQAERLQAAHLPTTLVGVLQARLDSLGEGERQALQQASIVGSVFWDEALAALDALAPARLPGLHQKALVQPREGSAFEGTTEEAFRHHLLQQVAYETVLKAARRRGHAAAARWLAQRVAGRASEHLAATARHFLQAGEDAEAARWLADAADHAAGRYDNPTAMAHAQRALDVVDSAQTELRARLLTRVVKVADLMADRAAQGQAIAQFEALAGEPGAPAAWRLKGQLMQATLCLRIGRHEESEQLALRTTDEAVAGGDDPVAAETFNLLLILTRLRGDHTRGREHALAGLTIARRCNMPSIELRLQGNLGLCDFELGRLESARDALMGSIVLARRHGPEQILPVLMCNLSAVYVEMADYEQGRRCAEEAVTVGTALGDRVHTLISQLNLSQALLGQGQCSRRTDLMLQAQALGTQCIQGLDAAQAPLHAAVAHDLQGEIELSLQRPEAALACFRAAQAAYAALGQEPARLKSLAAVAYLVSQRPEADAPQQGLALLAPVLAHLARCPADDPVASHLRTPWFCHLVLQAAGQADAPRLLATAQAALRGALQRLQDPDLRAQFARQFTFAPEIGATMAPAA